MTGMFSIQDNPCRTTPILRASSSRVKTQVTITTNIGCASLEPTQETASSRPERLGTSVFGSSMPMATVFGPAGAKLRPRRRCETNLPPRTSATSRADFPIPQVLLEKTEAGIVTQTSFSNHSTGPQVGVVTIPFMFTSATPAGQTWAIDVSALFPHPPGPSATHTVCGGTMHFDVTPAPPHLPSTLLFGPGLDNATAGQVASFTMALQDEYGNAVDVDLASVSAYLVPTRCGHSFILSRLSPPELSHLSANRQDFRTNSATKGKRNSHPFTM